MTSKKAPKPAASKTSKASKASTAKAQPKNPTLDEAVKTPAKKAASAKPNPRSAKKGAAAKRIEPGSRLEPGTVPVATIPDLTPTLKRAAEIETEADAIENGPLLPDISEGSTGPAVFVLQGLLRLHGYQVGSLDGQYGRETSRAVARFRSERKLAEGDRVDSKLWTALTSD